MMKTLKVYANACFALACGFAETFAIILVALALTGNGTVDARISGAIDKMANALMGVQVTDPAGIGRTISDLGHRLNQVPAWVFVCLAVWGLFRALMAIHGRGALRDLEAAVKELESSLTRNRRGVAVAKAAVKRQQKATDPTDPTIIK